MTHPLSSGELGIFLRTRRERVAPGEAGLPAGLGARRTPGLRREEVASLAGVSIDYYTRLERGRERHPSPAVLEALARVFRLTADERRYLYVVAGQAPASIAGPRQCQAGAGNGIGITEDSAETVRESVLLILASIRPSPAFVTSRAVRVLASNPAGRALFPGLDRPPARGNLSRYLFLEPLARTLIQGWEGIAAGHAAHLRSQLGEFPDAADLAGLISGLLARSPDFARFWDRYEIQPRTGGLKDFSHPRAGELHLDYESVPLAGTAGQRMLIYPTLPGTPQRDAVALLDIIGMTAEPAGAVDQLGAVPSRAAISASAIRVSAATSMDRLNR